MNNEEKVYLDANGLTQLVQLIHDAPIMAFFVDADGDIAINYDKIADNSAGGNSNG